MDNYVVRRTWYDEDSQIASANTISEAAAQCPLGYSVYCTITRTLVIERETLEEYVKRFEIPHGTYKTRQLSNIVRELLNVSGVSVETAAYALETSAGYFTNKLSRNSFSVTDICKLAELCGFSVCLMRQDCGVEVVANISHQFVKEV